MAMNGIIGLAQQAAPYAVSAMGNMFTAGGAPNYGTGQADMAMINNTNFAQNKTREQLAYENEMLRERERAAAGLRRENMLGDGLQFNAAANANTARNMAANAQTALNNVYQNAGDRLNTAAQNTANAINNAGNTVAGMFR